MSLFSKFTKNNIEAESVFFHVSMSCGKCEEHVKKALSQNKSVQDYTIDLDAKRVEVIFDKNKTTKEKIKLSIEDLGYTVTYA